MRGSHAKEIRYVFRKNGVKDAFMKRPPSTRLGRLSLGLVPLVLAASAGCNNEASLRLVDLSASEAVVLERSGPVTLSAQWQGQPANVTWKQISGPHIEIIDEGVDGATLVTEGVEVAAESEAVFELSGESESGQVVSAQVSFAVLPVDRVPAFGEDVRIGGSSAVATGFDHEGARWMAFGTGNRFTLSAVGSEAQPKFSLNLAGFIDDILVLDYEGRAYALVAMGSEGIAIVDISNTTKPALIDTVSVNYYQAGVTFAEGGGDIVADQVIESASGPITTLASDGTTLWIGDAGYGIHMTALSNLLLLDGVVREADGTLKIDARPAIARWPSLRGARLPRARHLRSCDPRADRRLQPLHGCERGRGLVHQSRSRAGGSGRSGQPRALPRPEHGHAGLSPGQLRDLAGLAR